jgi:hypothetical protein
MPEFSTELVECTDSAETKVRMELLTQQMAKQEGVTEALKAADQMDWVCRMNSIGSRVEEIVMNKLVYC